MLALAFLDEIFIFDVFMTGLTVEPGSKQIQFRKGLKGGLGPSDLLASSADWVMKKPTELAGILDMCGLMIILGSPPASSDFTSIASNSSFSLMKQSLGY